MEDQSKLSLIRIISIPVLLLLPVFLAIPGCAIGNENAGDSIPILSMLGSLVGGIVVFVLARRLFFRKDLTPSRAGKLLALALALEFGAVLITMTFAITTAFAQKAEPNESPQIAGR